MLHYYSNSSDFLFSNIDRPAVFSQPLTKKENDIHLFGYCVDAVKVYRNEHLGKDEFDVLLDKNVDICGVFSAIKFESGLIELILDPLCQFNIFYYAVNSDFVVSSSLLAIKEYLSLATVNAAFLYDQIAYQSPMRGLTILKDVFYIQFDDLEDATSSRNEFLTIDSNCAINIHRPKYEFYSHLTYNELLDLYIKRLNHRAQIVAAHFDHVHLQLTGGADSRLAFSSFSRFDNVECYVYGDGDNQNRLIFEEITRAKKARTTKEIRFVGQPLNTLGRISKALNDSNFFKFNNLNTCMNGPIDDNESYCKITGLYGANICNGVSLPSLDTSSNPRLNQIPHNLFTYHDYVSEFSSRHRDLRPAAFADRFYINNRGKSHCGAHSLVDNKYVNSVDILYDYINILLVQKCPYSDFDIDKSAITIDLIYLNDKQLALFPYDSRKIPTYRHFNNVPLINCFDGYYFSPKMVEGFKVIKPVVDYHSYNFIASNSSYMSNREIFKLEEVFDASKKYKYLSYLCDRDDVQSNIFLYFLLSKIVLDLSDDDERF